MTIRRMRIACWTPNTTDTHSEYVIVLLFHSNSGCTNTSQCYIDVCIFDVITGNVVSVIAKLHARWTYFLIDPRIIPSFRVRL